MSWLVEYTNEFGRWWDRLGEYEQDDITSMVELLEQRGPNLEYPYSSGVNGSRHSRMRELRTKSHGKQIRVFYAFDPRRAAILLLGAIKHSGRQFYKRLVPRVDTIYDQHLAELRKEGLIG